MKHDTMISWVSIFFILFLFVILSYFTSRYASFFESYFIEGYLGMLVFVMIVMLSIVLAPVSAVPLFPLASHLWGVLITGILAVFGWTMGSVIAFLLARMYGVALVKKVIPIQKIYNYEKKIPDSHLFLTVVVLRMVLPIDGVSYLFGLFSKMSLRSFTLATVIGITPFSFVIAYLGTMPFAVMLLFLVIAFLLFCTGVFIDRLHRHRKHVY